MPESHWMPEGPGSGSPQGAADVQAANSYAIAVALERIADALEALVPNKYTGKPA